MEIFRKILDYIKDNGKWFYPSVIFIVIAVASSFYYYYGIYLPEPNFSDENFNYVYSDAGEYIKPGSSITYVINCRNTGNRDVENLIVEAKIPEHTSFVSSDSGGPLTGDGNDGMLAFEVAEIFKKDEKATLSFVVEVDETLDKDTAIELNEVKFKYQVKGESFNDNIATNLVSKIESSPDLSNFKVEVVDENGDKTLLGDILLYTLTVKNTGDMDALDVEIRSDLSEFVEIIEDSISGQGEYKDNYVLWQIGNIGVNSPRTFFFKVIVKENLVGNELIENTSTLKCGSDIIEKSAEEKLDLTSDLATSEAYIYDANGGELYPGETISVRVVVRNTGDKKEDSYSVICPTPAGATYISQSGTAEGIRWSDEIRGLVWDLKDLGAGEEKEIAFRIKVNGELAGTGGAITTNFKVEGSGGEINLPQKSLSVRGNASVTIVAMGDSLIARSNWVQMFDNLLEANYPYAEYNTIASAKCGELARGGLARYDSTVGPHRPGIVIIAYGTNDVGPHYSEFSVSLEGMVIKAKSQGARVFINLIGPIDYPDKENYNEYNNVIRQIAAKHGAVVIDVLTPLSQNPGGYLTDGMHYSSAGASVVAHTVFNYVSRYLGSIGQRL